MNFNVNYLQGHINKARLLLKVNFYKPQMLSPHKIFLKISLLSQIEIKKFNKTNDILKSLLYRKLLWPQLTHQARIIHLKEAKQTPQP